MEFSVGALCSTNSAGAFGLDELISSLPPTWGPAPYLESVSLSSLLTFSPVARHHSLLSFPEHLHPFRSTFVLVFTTLISHFNPNPTSPSTVNMKFSTIILSTFLAALSVSAQNSTATPTSSVVSGTAPLTPAQSTEAACLEACESLTGIVIQSIY